MESIPPPHDSGAPENGVTGPSKEERTLAMVCHLLTFTGFLIPGIPVLNIVAPLVLWLIKKDSMPFVDQQGKEVLNFQITVSIALLICLVTIWLILPLFLMFGIAIVAIVLTIIGAIKANDGVSYRYPLTLRLIK